MLVKDWSAKETISRRDEKPVVLGRLAAGVLLGENQVLVQRQCGPFNVCRHLTFTPTVRILLVHNLVSRP